MNLTTIKAALVAWVESESSGTTAVWGDQAAPQTALPYVQLNPIGLGGIGGLDEQRETMDAEADIGEEVVLTTKAPQYLTLSVQAHAADVTAAMAIAAALKLALSKDARRSLLYAAGLSLVDCGTIRSVGKLVDAGLKGIAVFEPRFLALQQVEERTGYIAKITATGKFPNPGQTTEAAVQHTFVVDTEPPAPPD